EVSRRQHRLVFPAIAGDRKEAAVVLGELVDDQGGAQPLVGHVAGRRNENPHALWHPAISIPGPKVPLPADDVEIGRRRSWSYLVSMHRERQCDGAAKIRGRIPLQLVGREVEVRDSLEKALHRHLRDQPRHLAAEAEMLAGAETEMTLRAAI